MSFPWASFGSFVFKDTEIPLHGTDSGWNRESESQAIRTVNLGVNSPSYLKSLERGNATRSWECVMTYDRLELLQSYQNAVLTLVDWDRPVPNQWRAYFQSVATQERDIRASRIPNCTPGDNRLYARVSLTFVESS